MYWQMQESAQWRLLRQQVQWGANPPWAALRHAAFLVWVRLNPAPVGPKIETNSRAAIGRKCDMKLGNEMRMSAALVCAAALAGAALVVRAECGNRGASGNDAEVACHNCADDTWSSGSCTWHEAEAGDAYCGVCAPGYNCATAGTHPAGKVTTYTNGTCTSTGCIGGDPHTDPGATPNQNLQTSCHG
jgi:hypothetical protein